MRTSNKHRPPGEWETLGMFATPDFNGYDRGPRRFPKPAVDYVQAEANEQASFTSQIYAAAWTKAQRDHELDKLFNPEFYQAGDI